MRANEILTGLALSAVVVVCGVATIALVDIDQAAKKATVTLGSLNGTLVEINRPCKGPKGPDACGVFAQVKKSVIDIGDATVTAQVQVKNTGLLMATAAQGITSAASDLHEVAGQASSSLESVRDDAGLITSTFNDTMGQTQKTIEGIQPVETSLVGEIDAAHAATDSVNRFVASPDLIATLHNANTVSSNMALTSTDFQKKFHDVLYPPPCKGSMCWLIKSWPYIKDAGEMAEPAYWGLQVFKGIAH
jgi:hypothetical protein